LKIENRQYLRNGSADLHEIWLAAWRSGEGLVWSIGAVVCVVAAAFALPHHWLLPINCHFLRLYSAAGRGIAAVSSAIEESDLYLYFYISLP